MIFGVCRPTPPLWLRILSKLGFSRRPARIRRVQHAPSKPFLQRTRPWSYADSVPVVCASNVAVLVHTVTGQSAALPVCCTDSKRTASWLTSSTSKQQSCEILGSERTSPSRRAISCKRSLENNLRTSGWRRSFVLLAFYLSATAVRMIQSS